MIASGPGERMDILATQPLWLRVHLPGDGAIRAAAWGHSAELGLRLESAVGELWVWERPQRVPRPPQRPPPVAAPTSVAAPAARTGGLKEWMEVQAHNRFEARPLPRHGLANQRGDPEAMAVAGHVLELFLDAAPHSMVRSFADWRFRHIALAGRRAARAIWQWGLTVLAWVCEACGIAELWLAEPAMAGELLAEAGFTARALRQAPFLDWRRPGMVFPGSNATGRLEELGYP